MTRRIFCIVLSMLLMLSFAACNNEEEKGTESSKEELSAENSKEESAKEESSDEESSAEESSAEENSGEENVPAILGTWYAADHSLMLNDGGEGVFVKDGEFFELTWELKDGKLVFDSKDELPIDLGEQDCSLSEDGKKLTLGDTVYNSVVNADEEKEYDPALVGTWYCYDVMSGVTVLVLNGDGSGEFDSDPPVEIEWYSLEDKFTMVPMLSDVGDMAELAMTAKYSISAEGELRLEFGGELGTALGGEMVLTKTKRELGGNEALVGEWIDYNWDESSDKYDCFSIEFYEDGTGCYTPETEDFAYYSFLWAEKDGVISMELASFDAETFITTDPIKAEVSYTLEEDCLTLIYDGTETKYKLYNPTYDTGVDLEHPLGGDEAVIGTWVYDEEEEYTFYEDGSFTYGSYLGITEGSWYTDGEQLVAYDEDGYPILQGGYAVNGDYLDNNMLGWYTRLVRKGIEKTSYNIYASPAAEEELDLEFDQIFTDDSTELYLSFYASIALEDVKFHSLEFDENGKKLGEVLYSTESLEEYQSFAVPYPVYDEIPTTAISFKDVNGDVRSFEVVVIGEYVVSLKEIK